MSSAFDAARELFVSGVQHFEAGRMTEAQDCFQQSLELVPGRVSTRINLAATRIRLAQPAAALAELEDVLQAEPEHVDAWCHCATALADLGRDAESLTCADRALALDPAGAAAWYRRGHALDRLLRFDEAATAFGRVTALQPANADAWYRQAQMQQRLGRLEAALLANERVLALQPGHGAAASQRGMLLKDLGRGDAAAAAFEQALAAGADAELQRFFLASLGRQAGPAGAPRQYVQALFDDYAATFDQHLVDVLGYQAHRRLVAPLAALRPAGFDAALDLGCGTGLCAPPLRALVRRLDGVDLSQAMLDRAAALQLYDRLTLADVAEHLVACERRYGLVLAADVFIYVGELQAVFEGVVRVLLPGGVFCFSVEAAADNAGVQLTPQLRYAHSLPYLRALASSHGLQLLRSERQPIRQHQTESIPGLYVYLAKP